MNATSPLVLVDGSSYLFRAFFGAPMMNTRAGQPTNAIRGVVSMLLKLQQEYAESTIVVVFDAPGKTFRDEIYTEYKANRPPMPDDLRDQIEPIHQAVHLLGMPLLMIPDVEADDVIGTLAKQATEQHKQTVISASDKDLAQLVNEHITLIDSVKSPPEVLDIEGVKTKFGVRPDQIIDYLTLMGDKVDNIPGVEKCGKKTAEKWLNTYDTLENLVSHADEIKGKIGGNLRSAIEYLPRSKELATIKTDVELEESVKTLTRGEIQREALLEKFQEWEFRTLYEQVAGVASPVTKEDRLSIESFTGTIQSIDQLDSIVTRCLEEPLCSLYVLEEPDDTGYLGLGIAIPEDAFYLPLHDENQLLAEGLLSTEEAKASLARLVSHNALISFDRKSLRKVFAPRGLDIPSTTHDVMLAAYIVHSVHGGGLTIRTLAKQYVELDVVDLAKLTGTRTKRKPLTAVDSQELSLHACSAAHASLLLHRHLEAQLNDTSELQRLYEKIELPLEPVLYRMEQNGVVLDLDVLKNFGEELKVRVGQIEEQAYVAAGEKFKLGSPKQLQAILYDKLGLEAPRASRTGHRSTAENVLEEFARAGVHELPRLILDYRKATKLNSTYVKALQEQVRPSTNRVHTTFKQAHAITGRLASMDPNLQNIPIRTTDGRKVREAFVVPSGYLMASADYSQIELRVMAHITRDPGLTYAFANDMDVHRLTASQVYGVDLNDVSDDQRAAAKTINFGLMYGMSPFGLGRALKIPQGMAREIMEKYFEQYPAIHTYVDETKHKAKTHGYVETIQGRRIHLKDINNNNPIQRQAAERLAINAPVQGSAADIIKLAAIKVDQWLTESGLEAKLLLQIHDELLFEVAESDLEQLRAGVIECMANADELDVPLDVDFGSGSNWAVAH